MSKREIEIVWEAPPASAGIKPSMYHDVIAQLKERAGQWARVRATGSQSGAYSARKSFLKVAKDERFEARTGAIDGSDEFGVWARYRTREQMSEKR